MISEGIVTTLSARGELNIAPMGPLVGDRMQALLLRPFRTSRTYQNLKAHGEGVFHVTDDVLLLARAAVGVVDPPPPVLPARVVRGHVLADACRFYEFRIRSVDDREERAKFEADVLHAESLRDFFGFNRAKNAVLEAAILATRTSFLPRADVEADYRKLQVIVEKTGGPAEKEAFALLALHVAGQEKECRQSAPERVAP
jgi:hypothetical protein